MRKECVNICKLKAAFSCTVCCVFSSSWCRFGFCGRSVSSDGFSTEQSWQGRGRWSRVVELYLWKV